MSQGWVTPSVVLLAAVALGLAFRNQRFPKDPMDYARENSLVHPNKPFLHVPSKVLMDQQKDLPPLWLFYSSGEVNSRYWRDFMGRSSRVVNQPYMNLCYKSIVKHAAGKYRIEVIQGLPDAKQRLGGSQYLPMSMQSDKDFLSLEEEQFLAVAFLYRFGGLWISPSTIALQSIPTYPADKVIGFGTSDTDTYAGKAGTIVPNTQYMWAPKPGLPMFQKWTSMLFERLNTFAGGQRVRRDNQWDWTFVTTGETEVMILPNAMVQRKANGRRIELEDLFAAGTKGALPFPVDSKAIFVPIPYYELDRRSQFQWFLRLGESQIMTSDLAITYLFRKAL